MRRIRNWKPTRAAARYGGCIHSMACTAADKDILPSATSYHSNRWRKVGADVELVQTRADIEVDLMEVPRLLHLPTDGRHPIYLSTSRESIRRQAAVLHGLCPRQQQR